MNTRWAPHLEMSASQWQLYSAILCFRADPLRSSRMILNEWPLTIMDSQQKDLNLLVAGGRREWRMDHSQGSLMRWGHLGIRGRKWRLGVLAVHATKISTHSLPFCTPQPRFRSRHPPRLRVVIFKQVQFPVAIPTFQLQIRLKSENRRRLMWRIENKLFRCWFLSFMYDNKFYV